MPDTGWCESCSGITSRICVRCGDEFMSKTLGYVCEPCLNITYNDIEILLFNGFSLTRAKVIIAENNRAYCLCCGDYMPRALKGRHHFCTKKPNCRRSARRLKYYRQMLAMDKEAALERVLQSLEFEQQQAAIIESLLTQHRE